MCYRCTELSEQDARSRNVNIAASLRLGSFECAIELDDFDVASASGRKSEEEV